MRSLIRGFRSKPGRGNGGGGHSNPRTSAPRERGATLLIFALLIPALFAAGALTLDIGKLVAERQHLSNALDAGSLAGAASLPNDPVAAKAAALAFAKTNDPGADPGVVFWCVVASTGAAKTVDTTQFSSVCNPGTVAGAKCDEKICAVPCTPGASTSCNTITLTDDKDVPFNLAPAIGIDSGTTGALSSNACRGACGAQLPNPMDIVFVADRTGSMSTANRKLMATAIQNTLKLMTKEQQYVALGTIHKSAVPKSTCLVSPSADQTGTWVPVKFSNNYNKPSAILGAKPDVNTASEIYKELECLKSSPSSNGTYLASPMKDAARYLLDPSNVSGLPARAFPAKKAIIFETDGQPNESGAASGSTSLGTAGDITDSSGLGACNNLKEVAANAKAQDILIVTVAFGPANTATCAPGVFIRDVLAAAASKDGNGDASDADNPCSNDLERAAENKDGDYFFCAAEGSELEGIFASAVSSVTQNSMLIRIPN